MFHSDCECHSWVYSLLCFSSPVARLPSFGNICPTSVWLWHLRVLKGAFQPCGNWTFSFYFQLNFDYASSLQSNSTLFKVLVDLKFVSWCKGDWAVLVWQSTHIWVISLFESAGRSRNVSADELCVSGSYPGKDWGGGASDCTKQRAAGEQNRCGTIPCLSELPFAFILCLSTTVQLPRTFLMYERYQCRDQLQQW